MKPYQPTQMMNSSTKYEWHYRPAVLYLLLWAGNLKLIFMQKWRILYTSHPTIKQAVTKTGALKEGSASKSHYIIVEGKDTTDCLSKAKAECKFKDEQLLGMRRIE